MDMCVKHFRQASGECVLFGPHFIYENSVHSVLPATVSLHHRHINTHVKRSQNPHLPGNALSVPASDIELQPLNHSCLQSLCVFLKHVCVSQQAAVQKKLSKLRHSILLSSWVSAPGRGPWTTVQMQVSHHFCNEPMHLCVCMRE